MSLLNSLLDAVVAAQNTLTNTIEGNRPNAVKRKLPAREEQVDNQHQVSVCGQEKSTETKRLGFATGGTAKWKVLYRVEVTLISPGDRDRLLTLPDQTTWTEATRALYMTVQPLGTLPQVKQVDVVDGTLLDRSKLATGYDYNQLVLLVTTYESR